MVNHAQTKKILLVLKCVEDNSAIYVEQFVVYFVKEHSFLSVYSYLTRMIQTFKSLVLMLFL